MSPVSELYSAQYHRDGFVVVQDLLPSDVVVSVRARVTDIGAGRVHDFPAADIEFEPAGNGAVSTTARKINRCAENDPELMAVACRSEILDVVESLIGPDIKLFGSQCFMKPPGGIQKPYHQDSAYFTIAPPALVTCWIALDDVTVENGCLWVVPGSHADEVHDHSQPWEVAGRVDMQIPDDRIDCAREMPVTLSAGSCSFHHSVLLHRSGPNQTNRHRRGLAVHYMSSRSRWTHPTDPQPSYFLLRGRAYAGCV